MPTRMIRDSILESNRYLSLPDTTVRIWFIAALLTADDRRNLEASAARLVRVWRDFGVDRTKKPGGNATYCYGVQSFAVVDGPCHPCWKYV